MFPPQTSFIPTAVALARYVEAHGFGGSYPFWYLGTTPVKYLTGPVAPAILVGLHKIFPSISYFDLSYFIILASFFIHAAGWGLLAASLSGKRIVGLWVGALVLIAPFHIFWNLAFGEVTAIAAVAFTPWVLVAFNKAWGHVDKNLKFKIENLKLNSATPREVYPELLRRVMFFKWFHSFVRSVVNGRMSIVLSSLLFALLLLVNTTSAVPAMIGLAILGIISHRHWEDGLKRAAGVVILGLILTLWWYWPAYWLTIAGASSIGGRSALGAFVWILNMLRSLVPIILALAVVMWGFKPKGQYWRFIIAWTAVFGLLTLLRFAANVDFWLDWTVWMGEVEVGLVLLLGHFLARSSNASVLRSDVRRTSDTLALRARLGFTRSKASSLLNESSGGIHLFEPEPQSRRPERESKGYVFGYFKTVVANSGYLLLVTCYVILGYFFAFQNREFWLPRGDISQTVEYKIADRLNKLVKANETVFLSGSTAFWLNSLVDIKQVRGGRDEVSVDPSINSGQANWREAAWEIRQGSDPRQLDEVIRRLGIDYLVVHTERSGEFYHDFEDVEKFEQIKSLEKVYVSKGDIIYKVK